MEIGCIVMAAGNAARFGENKLAAQVAGRTLAQRALDAVPVELLARVAVVTQYEEVAELARQHGFLPLRNPHPDWGLSHTIRLGTQALASCDGILYLVSDQPLLTREAVARVVHKWLEDPTRIAAAGHGGVRGNPCLFPRAFFPALMALRGDRGGSAVIRAHPDRLTLVELPAAQLTDVDTPEALQKLET